jgi:hypothetical protein
MLGPATDGQVRAAQILSGATMAAWLACGWIPGLRPHATKIRTVLIAAYVLCCGAFIGYVIL